MPRIELAQERPLRTARELPGPAPARAAGGRPAGGGALRALAAAGAEVRGRATRTSTCWPRSRGAPRRATSRRVFALLALAALLIAIARPQRTVAAERREATVMLVFDTSGSMLATDVQPSRLAAAQLAGNAFVEGAGRVPGRRRRLRLERPAARRADDGQRAGEGDDRLAAGRGRDRDGRRAEARDQLGAGADPGRARRRAPAAGGDRPARRRREHPRRRTRSTSSRTPRSTRSRSTPSRWARRTARSPTPTRTPARHQHRARPAGPADAAGHRARHRRPVLRHRRRATAWRPSTATSARG